MGSVLLIVRASGDAYAEVRLKPSGACLAAA
jgi:hypothetical protein